MTNTWQLINDEIESVTYYQLNVNQWFKNGQLCYWSAYWERDINSVNSETHPLALSLSYVLITSTESTISVIVGESSLIKI